jgi:hypothetical protein
MGLGPAYRLLEKTCVGRADFDPWHCSFCKIFRCWQEGAWKILSGKQEVAGLLHGGRILTASIRPSLLEFASISQADQCGGTPKQEG